MSKSIYDENNYLNNDDLINDFKSDYKLRERVFLEEEKLYKDTIDNYNNLIYELASLIKKLGYNNGLDSSILLSYLINAGYLSNEMKFTKKGQDDKISSKLGISIIDGYGVCRNYAAMHKDIFGYLSLYDKQLYCYNGIGNGKRKPANHVINLIYYDSNYYGIDIYNGNRLYKFTNELDMLEISLYFSNHLRYKPYYEIITGESDESDINNNLFLFNKYSLNNYMNAFLYDEIKHEIMKRVISDEKAYIEFYNNNKKLIKSIKNSL